MPKTLGLRGVPGIGRQESAVLHDGSGVVETVHQRRVPGFRMPGPAYFLSLHPVRLAQVDPAEPAISVLFKEVKRNAEVEAVMQRNRMPVRATSPRGLS